MQILDVLGHDIDSPTSLDFVILYFRVIKHTLQTGEAGPGFTKSFIKLIFNLEVLSYDLTKVQLLDTEGQW